MSDPFPIPNPIPITTLTPFPTDETPNPSASTTLVTYSTVVTQAVTNSVLDATSKACSEIDQVWFKSAIILVTAALVSFIIIFFIIYRCFYRRKVKTLEKNYEKQLVKYSIPALDSLPRRLEQKSESIKDVNLQAMKLATQQYSDPTNPINIPITGINVNNRDDRARKIDTKATEDDLTRDRHLDMVLISGRNDQSLGRTGMKQETSSRSKSKRRKQKGRQKENSLKHSSRQKNPTFVVDKTTNQVKRVDPDPANSANDDLPSILDANAKAINIPFKF